MLGLAPRTIGDCPSRIEMSTLGVFVRSDKGEIEIALPMALTSVVELAFRLEFWLASRVGVIKTLSIEAEGWLSAMDLSSLLGVDVIVIWSFADVGVPEGVRGEWDFLSSPEDVLDSLLVISLLAVTVEVAWPSVSRVAELLDVMSFAGVEVLESLAGVLVLVMVGDDEVLSLLESVELEALVVELVLSFVKVESVEEPSVAAVDVWSSREVVAASDEESTVAT